MTLKLKGHFSNSKHLFIRQAWDIAQIRRHFLQHALSLVVVSSDNNTHFLAHDFGLDNLAAASCYLPLIGQSKAIDNHLPQSPYAFDQDAACPQIYRMTGECHTSSFCTHHFQAKKPHVSGVQGITMGSPIGEGSFRIKAANYSLQCRHQGWARYTQHTFILSSKRLDAIFRNSAGTKSRNHIFGIRRKGFIPGFDQWLGQLPGYARFANKPANLFRGIMHSIGAINIDLAQVRINFLEKIAIAQQKDGAGLDG